MDPEDIISTFSRDLETELDARHDRILSEIDREIELLSQQPAYDIDVGSDIGHEAADEVNISFDDGIIMNGVERKSNEELEFERELDELSFIEERIRTNQEDYEFSMRETTVDGEDLSRNVAEILGIKDMKGPTLTAFEQDSFQHDNTTNGATEISSRKSYQGKSLSAPSTIEKKNGVMENAHDNDDFVAPEGQPVKGTDLFTDTLQRSNYSQYQQLQPDSKLPAVNLQKSHGSDHQASSSVGSKVKGKSKENIADSGESKENVRLKDQFSRNGEMFGSPTSSPDIQHRQTKPTPEPLPKLNHDFFNQFSGNEHVDSKYSSKGAVSVQGSPRLTPQLKSKSKESQKSSTSGFPKSQMHEFLSTDAKGQRSPSIDSIISIDSINSQIQRDISASVHEFEHKEIRGLPDAANSRMVVSALRTLQDKIRQLEIEKQASQNRIEDLENQVSKYRQLLYHEQNMRSASDKNLEELQEVKEDKKKLQELLKALRIQNKALEKQMLKKSTNESKSTVKDKDAFNLERKKLKETIKSLQSRNNFLEQQLDYNKYLTGNIEEERDQALKALAEVQSKTRKIIESKKLSGSSATIINDDESTNGFHNSSESVNIQQGQSKIKGAKTKANGSTDSERARAKTEFEVKAEESKDPDNHSMIVEAGQSVKDELFGPELSPQDEGLDGKASLGNMKKDIHIARKENETERKIRELAEKKLGKRKKEKKPKSKKQKTESDTVSVTWQNVDDPSASTTPTRSSSVRAPKQKMADDDVEKVVKLKRPPNMGREVPFIVGKNVGKSHSVTANLQKMYSMLKSHNPALCTLCSNYKQRFGTAVRSSESPHHPMTFESILDAHARSREDNTETSAKPQFQTRSRSRSLGRSRSRVRYSVAEVGDAKNDKNMLSVPDVEDSQPKSGDLPDDGIPDDILQMPNSGIERVIKGLEDEFRHLKMHYQLLVTEYEQLDPIKNINGNEEAVENGKLPVHKETLQAVADDLRMVIHNMTVKSDQITTLREIQLLNASSSNDTLQPSASRPQSRPISSRSYSSKGPTYLRSNCSVPNGTMDYQSTVSSSSSNPPSSIAGKSSVAAQAGSVMDHEDSDLRPISRTGRTKSATVNSRKKSRSQSKRRFEDERGIKMTDMDDYDEDAPVTYAAQSRFMNSLSLLKGSQKVQRVLAEQ